MTRTYTIRNWLDSIFNLRELLSLSENELVQLEELDGDVALKAAWWRRRRAVCPSDGRPPGKASWQGLRHAPLPLPHNSGVMRR